MDSVPRRELSTLKITKVKTTPISVPMQESYTFSVGKVGGTSKVIVEVETSAGITGVGEAFPLWTAEVIDEVLGPAIIGENPFNLARITSKCLPTNANPSLPYVDVFHLPAFGGIEMALWDVMGKAAELPAAMLMGGVYRTEIPFSDYVFVSGHLEPEGHMEDIVRYSRELVTTYGSPTIEFKVGVMPPPTDVETVRRVRDSLGDRVAIRVDANAAWTESTALATLRGLEKYDLANIEEPCGSLESNSKVRRVSKTPMPTHSTRVVDVANAGLDAAVVNPVHVGGFSRLKRQVTIAEERGLDVWLHSRAELGFGTAAYLHFVAANRWLSLPNQTLMRTTEDMLTKEPKPELRNGTMKLPPGHGLGVTLDLDKLQKYNSLFREAGEILWLGGSAESPPFY